MPNQEYNSNLINYIIQLAQKANAQESFALLLDNLWGNAQKEKQEEDRKDKAASSIVLFTTKELSKMPQQFRKMFKTNNIRAHVKRRPDGLYEIRCQINKTLYVATSKYLDVCKEKFITKLKDAESGNKFLLLFFRYLHINSDPLCVFEIIYVYYTCKGMWCKPRTGYDMGRTRI